MASMICKNEFVFHSDSTTISSINGTHGIFELKVRKKVSGQVKRIDKYFFHISSLSETKGSIMVSPERDNCVFHNPHNIVQKVLDEVILLKVPVEDDAFRRVLMKEVCGEAA